MAAMMRTGPRITGENFTVACSGKSCEQGTLPASPLDVRIRHVVEANAFSIDTSVDGVTWEALADIPAPASVVATKVEFGIGTFTPPGTSDIVVFDNLEICPAT